MLLYSDQSYAINGAAFHVYNKLGHGFLRRSIRKLLKSNSKDVIFLMNVRKN